MSSLSRLFGALASEELTGITKESAKDPAFREVVVRSAGHLAASSCAEVIANIGAADNDTPQSVDRAIVALVQYRDVIDPPMYLSNEEAADVMKLEGQERGDRFMELTDAAMEHSNKRHERLVGTQKYISKALREHITTELDVQAEAELKERFGDAVANAIFGGRV